MLQDAEGVLRALRLLNGVKIDGQELLLKSNTATQKYLEAYEAQRDQQRRAKAEQQQQQQQQDGAKEVRAGGTAVQCRRQCCAAVASRLDAMWS
jgi:RNA-binding protein 25